MAEIDCSVLTREIRPLKFYDPFLVSNSKEILEFLQTDPPKGLCAFSLDVKDLYYSLPHDQLLYFIEEYIDEFGSVFFQNAAGVPVSSFLQLLSFYLRSTYIEYDGKPCLQSKGICIGSCIAPILSDLFLCKLDNGVAACFDKMKVIRVFRFVDDFLFFVDCKVEVLESRALEVQTIVKDNFKPLIFTHELPVNQTIQFLDINLTFSPDHTCWMYHPRSDKPLLPYHSAHSKLVKRGIISMRFTNAIKKSCAHSMTKSLCQQSLRLSQSGYPVHVQISVAESLIKKTRTQTRDEPIAPANGRPKLVVIPYLHGVSHNLKKIAGRADIKVVFSAPNKLASLCKASNPYRQPPLQCSKKHVTKYVKCVENVVYEIPLSCGKRYIGQSGRCLNERLREHSANVRNGRSGWLAHHCSTCGCDADFYKCVVIRKNKD